MTDTKKREKARQAPTYSHVGETGHFNFSPAGFRRWANQFYQCRQSFQCPDFSPVRTSCFAARSNFSSKPSTLSS
jgi:hypothetical protein